MSDLAERLYRVIRSHPTIRNKEVLATELGCSRSMLHHYEKGNPPPPEHLLKKLIGMEVALGIMPGVAALRKTPDDREFPETPPGPGHPNILREDAVPYRVTPRRVPVIGWAHAGAAGSYEELPKHWQETVSSDCRDAKAFAVQLEGDSMEPFYREGDTLVLMPSQEIHNGCLAVIRFANDGVIFRRVETRKGRIRLVPLNARYEAEEHECSEISWAYPVYERRTLVWRG